MGITWRLTEADQEVFRRELDEFLPDRVYDAHAHLYQVAWWDDPTPHALAGPPETTLDMYREQLSWLLPGRQVHGLHFAYPFPTESSDRTMVANEWVAGQMAADPLAQGQLLVRAADDPDWVRQEVHRLGFRGLKPFAFYANVDDIYLAEIPDILPEPLAAAANDHGWSVTLHLMRSRGIADPSNQHWVRHYCETYPNMQLVLDHCARGFNPYHVLEGLGTLADLPNLWVDTSAVCKALAVETVLRVLGPARVMYGSDFFVSHIRGTNFSLGDTFIWVDERTAPGELAYSEVVLPLVGMENLRATRAACRSVGLSDAEVEDVFWNNAASLRS